MAERVEDRSGEPPATDARRSRPHRVPVELGKLREIARAMKSSNPAYLEGERPLTPPPFFYGSNYLWGHTWEDPGDSPLADVELDRDRLLHAEEEVVLHGEPPRAGDVLRAEITVESSYTKQNRRGQTLRFVVALTEFRGADGVLVAEARSTVVEMPAADSDGSGS